MAKKKAYFGNDIKPACAYCQFGDLSKEGDQVVCEKSGLVKPESSCKKWVYDPIKRIPRKQREIPQDD